MALTELKSAEDTMHSPPSSSMPDSVVACHEDGTINLTDQSADKLTVRCHCCIPGLIAQQQATDNQSPVSQPSVAHVTDMDAVVSLFIVSVSA